MPTIHLHETTTATPEQFVAALTDFGPGRSKLFPNSADEDLEVHDHRLQRVGRQLGPQIHLHAEVRRDDRLGRRRGA
jgi:hypothetical protein